MAPPSPSTVFDEACRNLAGVHKLVNTSNGKRQTSTVAVVWLPDIETNATPFVLDPDDVREEFIRTSGKGGQNRNKVSSCVRLTHLPTGIQVVADNQRHLAQNRADAWQRLTNILQASTTADKHQTLNSQRVEQLDNEGVVWTWTEWRDEVKGRGRRTSMARALNGKLDPLLK